MKRIFAIFFFAVLATGLWAQNGKVGASCGIAGGTSPQALAKIKDAGIKYIEIGLNSVWRNKPINEVYIRAYQKQKNIKASGLKVWSVHLPFNKKIDISVLDNAQRNANVEFMEEMIRLAGIFKPKYLVLHPGADTIKDEKTRKDRLKCAKNSIGRLALAAKEIGAVLCIENLPRTCPGRTPEEMDYLTSGIPNVKVCFDTNHLLLDTHDRFFEVVGDRIATLHVSDYDGVDEKHWLPFHEDSIVDWGAFYRNLKKYKYKGVFMYEVSGKHGKVTDLVPTYKKIKKAASCRQDK